MNPAPAAAVASAGHTQRDPLFLLAISALGVVFGDIGTSPLYALKECFNPEHGIVLNPGNVLGVLSLLFWSMTIVVSVKYVSFIMRADNRGEGGILALLALATHYYEARPRLYATIIGLGLFGAAMFYGDSMITPAISVLSAVEGLEIATPAFTHYVIPITLIIIVGLFSLQRKGTASVGKLFGPIMMVWFAVLAVMGIARIAQNPHVLWALNPWHAVLFWNAQPVLAFVLLGSIFLVLTGGEALYADMGHFGRRPIQLGWFVLAMPALVLNYFGQGAQVLADPDSIKNPFFLMAPTWAVLPLVLLSAIATVIASQAVISGAFSMTSQAMKLGYCPRMRIDHTSEKEIGQIYLPFINWILLVAVVLLVLGFKSSSNLAAAYGIAVSSTMIITTLLGGIVAVKLWGWNRWIVFACFGAFGYVDMLFLGANALKIAEGGWFPLLMGGGIFGLLVTWKRGRSLLLRHIEEDGLEMKPFVQSLVEHPPQRVEGTAVFLSSRSNTVPHALLHNLKHNKVLHERNVFLTFVTAEQPYVDASQQIHITEIAPSFYQMEARYGFKQEANVTELFERCRRYVGLSFEMMETSFFVARETVVPTEVPGMAIWREHVFAWMQKNATPATDFFRIPANRVVELGTKIEI